MMEKAMQITQLYGDTDRPMKILLLASGRGTNFERIFFRQKELGKSGEKNHGRIECVFSNNPEAGILAKAVKLKIPSLCLSSAEFFRNLRTHPSDERGRGLYDSAVISLVEKLLEPDLVVLAGYRRKLSRMFTERFKNRIVNLYPGDTTVDYLVKGKDACVCAVENGEKTIRCTAYIENDPEKRFGPPIAQSTEISLEGFSVEDSDAMGEKIRKLGEWKLFPFVVHDLVSNGRVAVDSENNVYVDGRRTEKGGFQL